MNFQKWEWIVWKMVGILGLKLPFETTGGS